MIKRVLNDKDLGSVIQDCIKEIYYKGPTNPVTIEILSTIKYHQPDIFSKYEDQIIINMGLFYKNVNIKSFHSAIINIYKEMIYAKYQKNFNPIQAELIENSKLNQVFSFSTGTSVGKSFVFRELIDSATNDVMIVVPSRALINEYIIELNNKIVDKRVNILSFIDVVNTEKARKNIFVVTPERAKELFKLKDKIQLEMVLFDEAQLAAEKSIRGLNFDSIVRRIDKHFPHTKLLFAHPFIKNPIAQIERNNLTNHQVFYKSYLHRTVGQVYISYIDDKFYQFGINKSVMGNKKQQISFNPIERVLEANGSLLIYTSKRKIIDSEFTKLLVKYRKYFKGVIKEERAIQIIKKLERLLGVNDYRKSNFIKFMRFGIVIHHGSMPLEVRKEIEKFVKYGFSRVCIATSTLYQGINMPFDLVWIDRFEESKELGVKNLIGRGGRSTDKPIFDVGIVLIKDSNKSNFRNLMLREDYLSNISYIDTNIGDQEIDVIDFKDAIKNDDFSLDYNLTNKEVKRLSDIDLNYYINLLLDSLIEDDKIISQGRYSKYSTQVKLNIYECFTKIYTKHLKRNYLNDAERDVLVTAIQILLWKMFGRTFSEICGIRYALVTKRKELNQLKMKISQSEGYIRLKYEKELMNMKADYMVGYHDLPNINLYRYPKYKDTTIHDVEYDDIVYDTFDYLDKLINLKLIDIFYATIHLYYKNNHDYRALILSNYVKYGTNNEKVIWLVRYGYEHHEIEWLIDHVLDINEKRIEFKNSIYEMDEEKIERIKRHF